MATSPFYAIIHSTTDNQSPTTAAELRRWREAALAQAAKILTQSPEDWGTEVDWLLRELAQIRPSQFKQAPPAQSLTLACSLSQLDEVWQRRLQEHQPLQYLVGHVPWRDLELVVGPGVLIPRPETELMIDAVAQLAEARSTAGLWADIGTGSGAIALGLASRFKQMQIHAVDCSPAALAIAQANVERYAQVHHLMPRLQLHLGQWLEPLAPWRGKFQGIVSNPPYIPTEAIAELQAEVRNHEPHLALDGGEDGLGSIRHLIQAGADFLAPGGVWIVELMAGQAAQVESQLQAHGGYQATGRICDLSGIERFVWAKTHRQAPDPTSDLTSDPRIH